MATIIDRKPYPDKNAIGLGAIKYDERASEEKTTPINVFLLRQAKFARHYFYSDLLRFLKIFCANVWAHVTVAVVIC